MNKNTWKLRMQRHVGVKKIQYYWEIKRDFNLKSETLSKEKST